MGQVGSQARLGCSRQTVRLSLAGTLHRSTATGINSHASAREGGGGGVG